MRAHLKNLAKNWHEALTWLLVLKLLAVALTLLAYVMGMVTLLRVAPASATFGYAILVGMAELGLVTGAGIGVVKIGRWLRSR